MFISSFDIILSHSVWLISRLTSCTLALQYIFDNRALADSISTTELRAGVYSSLCCHPVTYCSRVTLLSYITSEDKLNAMLCKYSISPEINHVFFGAFHVVKLRELNGVKCLPDNKQ